MSSDYPLLSIDVSDLQNFVNVALATAADVGGALAHDRLSNLRTVGSGFGSLIYKLREDTGFVELLQRCEALWTVLENNPNLPIMLVSSSITDTYVVGGWIVVGCLSVG